MNANKMTQKTLETLQQAAIACRGARNTQVGQIHVFHALLDDPDDLNAQLMASMGISTDELRAAIDTELDKQATFGSSGGGAGLYDSGAELRAHPRRRGSKAHGRQLRFR